MYNVCMKPKHPKEKVTLNLYKDQIEWLRKNRDESGVLLSEQIRRAIDKEIEKKTGQTVNRH